MDCNLSCERVNHHNWILSATLRPLKGTFECHPNKSTHSSPELFSSVVCYCLAPAHPAFLDLCTGDRATRGTVEITTEGDDDDVGDPFEFEDSEEEAAAEVHARLVVSNARTELGTRAACPDPPRRRRSSISDDLEPCDEWEAEEALLEGRILLTQPDSGTNLGKDSESVYTKLLTTLGHPFGPPSAR